MGDPDFPALDQALRRRRHRPRRISIHSEPFLEASCNPTMSDGTNPEMLCFCVKTWLHFDAEPGLLGEGRVMKGDAFTRVWVQGIMTCPWKVREFLPSEFHGFHRYRRGLHRRYVSYVSDQLLRPQIRTALNSHHRMFSGWPNWQEQIFGIQVKKSI